jgi:hypothetical protein
VSREVRVRACRGVLAGISSKHLLEVSIVAKKPATKIVHRSSDTGKFVPAEEVKKHPKTTETERVKVPPTKAPKKK